MDQEIHKFFQSQKTQKMSRKKALFTKLNFMFTNTNMRKTKFKCLKEKSVLMLETYVQSVRSEQLKILVVVTLVQIVAHKLNVEFNVTSVAFYFLK